MMLRTIKKSGLWSFVIAVLMAAQFALAFHSLEHKFNPDAAPGDECALCQVASTMALGPTAELVAAPVRLVFVGVDVVVLDAPREAASPAGFRSRAPPLSLSV